MLKTWLQGPGFGPVQVVDKNDMSWRQYTNVTIDTVYFSVFFGGSSETFQAKKDEVISLRACMPAFAVVLSLWKALNLLKNQHRKEIFRHV